MVRNPASPKSEPQSQSARLEGHRGQVPEARVVGGHVAGRQHAGALCGAVVPDVPQPAGVRGGWRCRWRCWREGSWSGCSSSSMTAGMAPSLPPRRANDVLGFITGVLTFTPYYHWRWEHAVHHASSGDLDRRGMGDVWTLTVQEYLEASRWKRFAYRLARNPVILFGLAPLYLFLIHMRFPSTQGRGAGAALGVVDESGVGGAGGRAELAVRPQGVFAAAVDRAGGGRVGGGMVVLCAAPV